MDLMSLGHRALKNARWLFLAILASTMLTGCELFEDLFDDDGDNDITLGYAPFSSTIAISGNRKLLGVVNEHGTVTFFRLSGTNQTLLAEVPVGKHPSHIAFHPNNREAWVTNAEEGTVSVIGLTGGNKYKVIQEIAVDEEPRGIIFTPNAGAVYVAHHTSPNVTQINPRTRAIVRQIDIGGFGYGLVSTNDLDDSDTDETVYATNFYSRLKTDGNRNRPVTQDNEGVVRSIAAVNGTISQVITLDPIADAGFTVDRNPFCTNNGAVNDTFCENNNAAFDEGAFPNQLRSGFICANRLFIPSIGAAPEPPVQFNNNVQALLSAINTSTNTEIAADRININDQIKNETQPVPARGQLGKLFMGDLVQFITFGSDCANGLALSRANDYVLFGTVGTGTFEINDPNNVVRVQVGHIPTGMVANGNFGRNASLAFVNNSVDATVSVIDLNTQTVLRTLESSKVPTAGSLKHQQLLGKLAFFTGLGIPADEDENGVDILGVDIRDIDTLDNRNRASDNGWSSCGSCHPAGLADGVTWIFATGPRQTIPLDASWGVHTDDQRIFNWSAVRGSVIDFNNNARNVQGGQGFDGEFDVNEQILNPNPAIFNHGVRSGISLALDTMTLWVQATVRNFNMPAGDAAAVTAGEAVFDANCASCHGGAKWTKSQVAHYKNNPTFEGNPLAGGTVIDPNLTVAGPQLIQMTDANDGANIVTILDDVGTFDAAGDFEIRGTGGAIGQGALGALGFNSPGLLTTAFHAPFFHDGSAENLAAVFAVHELPGGGTIADNLNAQQEADLTVFLNQIDGATDLSPTDNDMQVFLEAAAN